MTVPSFFAVNMDKAVPEMLVYGLIGDGEGLINAGAFVQAFKSLEATNSDIHVRINSGGGSIFEGLAMYNCIKNSKANVTTYIDGMAASMGSILALAGKQCYMSQTARLMTHKAKGVAVGGAQAMRDNAALMESLEDTMAAIYAQKCGMDKATAKSTFMGDSDKWMTAKEALELKLIDGVYDAKQKVSAPATATSELMMWAAYEGILKIANDKTDNTMSDFKLSAEYLGKLSLGTNSTEAEVKAAIDGLIAKAAQVATLEARATQAETALAAAKTEGDKREVEAIIASALASNKMTVEMGNLLKAQFAGNTAGLKAIVDAMPSYNPLTTQIATGAAQTEVAKLVAMSYDELDKAEKLERLKELDLNAFRAKFKEAFGKEWK